MEWVPRINTAKGTQKAEDLPQVLVWLQGLTNNEHCQARRCKESAKPLNRPNIKSIQLPNFLLRQNNFNNVFPIFSASLSPF